MSSLDTDWNALRTAVCGSARGAGCTGGASAQLGASWVQGFESSLGEWRTFRDEFRQRWFTWGISDGHAIDRWRDELTRYREGVQRVTGRDPIADAQEAPPDAIERMADAAGEGIRRAGTGFGVAAGIAIVVVGAIAVARAHG